MQETNLPSFTRDIPFRALQGTLAWWGQSPQTLMFAAICGLGYWWVRCRREGRRFLSLPAGWKQKTWDAVGVTAVALVIIFALNLWTAAHDRDVNAQAIIEALRAENALLKSAAEKTTSGSSVAPLPIYSLGGNPAR